jgi:Co/Zn/Cd efflux system component
MKTSTKFTMERSDHSLFRHTHNFVPDFSGAERRTRIVIAITAVMMVLEITVGLISHSMALLADGWHMSTHVIAFLPQAFLQRAVHLRDRENWGSWRFLQCSRAGNDRAAHGGRIGAPFIRSPNHSF